MVPITVAELSALLQDKGDSAAKTHAGVFGAAGRAAAPATRRLLNGQTTLTEVERVLLANLRPLGVHEAYELIPSLRDHIGEAELFELLRKIVTASKASKPVIGTARLGFDISELSSLLAYRVRN